MRVSPITGTNQPEATDVPAGHTQMTDLIANLERFVIGRFASMTALNTAIPAPTTGMVAFVAGVFVWRDGAIWRGLTSPQPQFFQDNVVGGTATTYTAMGTHNNILTAPFPLTMIVEASGDMGANGGPNVVQLRLTDEAGTSIALHTGFIEPGSLHIGNLSGSEGKNFSFAGKKDYAAGATCGYRFMYKVNAQNIYISGGVKVTFHPKTS